MLLTQTSNLLIKQYKKKLVELREYQCNKLKEYKPNLEQGVDHSDYIYYSFEDMISYTQSEIDEQYNNRNNYL
tara:strand:- start:353 stop:571 length:219 start_codon:yes stop_codon:yes gene_type:complete